MTYIMSGGAPVAASTAGMSRGRYVSPAASALSAATTVTSSTIKCYRVDREVFEVELGPLQKLMQTEKRRSINDALIDENDVSSAQGAESAAL